MSLCLDNSWHNTDHEDSGKNAVVNGKNESFLLTQTFLEIQGKAIFDMDCNTFITWDEESDDFSLADEETFSLGLWYYQW